jgi:ribonuclease D
MPKNDLFNLELDEVSLVGKAANGKKFLIYKSMNKGRTDMRQNAPGRAAKAGAGALVTKADIASMISGAVEKAIQPLADENKLLRKSIKAQGTMLRKRELEEIAKSKLDSLGNPAEVADILKSLEDSDLPQDARKSILKTLKQANAIKKESMKLMGGQIGSSRPAPGSAMAEFEELVNKEASEIKKSATAPSDPKVLNAMAVAAVTKSHGKLARAVIAEERQASFRFQAGVQ